MNAAPDSSAPVPSDEICIFSASHAFGTVHNRSSGAHSAGIFPSLARMGIQESLTCEAWVRKTPKNVEIRTLANGHPSELG